MTIMEAKAIVKNLGLQLIRKVETNEYIIRDGKTTYYTDDLQDAVDTAVVISTMRGL